MKVFIKSIPRETASKIHEIRDNRSGKKLNKNKITSRCKDGFQALWSPSVGGLKTGLYKKLTLEDGTVTTYQDWAEKKWNLPKGYLTNRAWRKGDSMANEDMTYFQKKAWKLNDGTTVLDLELLDDFCAYHMFLESKSVANSEREWKEHRWPKAKFYIALENESDAIKYKKTQRKARAFAALYDKALTLPWKRKFVAILGIASDRVQLTEEQINNQLYDFIDKSQLHDGDSTNINKFLTKFEALKKKDTRERLEAEYELQKLIDWRIVFEKSGTYTWLSKGMELGYNKTEAVDFLLNPKKQVLVEELQEELALKKASR